MKKIFILFVIGIHLIVLNSCDQPGDIPGINEPDTGSNGSQDSSKQCTAITQSGTQCKRKASTESSYCWQHQP